MQLSPVRLPESEEAIMAETNLTVPPGSTAAPPAATGPTVTELVTGILNDAQRLLHQQVDMLKSEFHEDLRRTKQAAMFGGLGIVGLTVGALGIVFFLVYLLNEKAGFALWASFGIIGGIFLAVGVVLTLTARHLFESFNPLPDKTFTALQENLSWTTK
jgi:hypothetical protein